MPGLEQPTLGERLRIARATAGLTQEQVAAQLKLARTTLVAIERGERPVRPEELVALAKVFGTTTNALLRRDAVHVDFVAQFRRPTGARLSEAEATDAIRLLHHLSTATVELERRLGRPLRYSYPPERALARGKLDQQAEDLALELRNQLGLGVGPIVDVFSLAELELGMRIFVRPIASAIGGVFAYHVETGACVLINANHPEERRVWSLAHEIAHLLTSRSVTDVCVVDARKPTTDKFADLFAAAFLLPGAAMRRRFAETTETEGRFSARHLGLLAERYHVSVEAITRRLEQLELLPHHTFERLRRSGLTGKSLRELVSGVPRQELAHAPLRLTLLAAEAHGRGLLSEAQVASMLAVDLMEARRLLDELPDDEVLEQP